ncbi:hypothetical protein [Silvanigrella aquatica]|uniref:Uncharacterized protein n=1 Tax=Silvanigrella aquatica TaxID=1915309 RepID=A0A1L4CYJ9_9BACT|nr:hypothetical protein [Silvanigrella aquatica]APJ03028.1 hypothetical protein AXG55_03505 [Silvanigrella aquatica]
MKKKQNSFTIVVIIFSFINVSCSGNILSSLSTQQSTQEQAQVDMQNGNYADAQSKLQSIISSNSTNYTAVSLLAACYAAEGGVILLNILLNASTSSSLSTASSNPISFSASLLPSPTATVLAQMVLATNTMATIPAASMTSDMQLQQQLLLSIYLFLQMQSSLAILQAGGTISAAQATQIFSTITNVNSLTGVNSSVLNQAISSLTSGVSGSAGGTQAQQITNYLTPYI